MSIMTLKLPDLTTQNFVTSYAQQRPFRKGGIRLEYQNNKKHIFHNYGHGGAGISLSYGSVFVTVNSIRKNVKSEGPLECGVIGAGIMGLMTALQLVKKGHRVTIYSQKFSNKGQKDNEKCITSQVAPGFWFPVGYDNNNIFKHQLLSRLTFEYFSECLKLKKYKAIKSVLVYDKSIPEETLRENLPEILSSRIEKVKVNFTEGGTPQQFIKFTTIKIDCELFLEELKQELVSKGIKFISRKFNSISDVETLPESVIFNCSGMGSRTIFNDQNLIGVRGHLLEYKNTDPSVNVCFIRQKISVMNKSNTYEDRIVYIYAHERRILIGLTWQEDKQAKVDEKIVEKMKANIQKFIVQKKSPYPKL